MSTIHRQIWIVCALAFLLMAGGQAFYACADWTCSSEQASADHSSCPDPEDCPDGPCCGHIHASLHLTMLEHAVFLFMVLPSQAIVIDSETCQEGPCREIDHPPQLA